jgi:hypothetical protein
MTGILTSLEGLPGKQLRLIAEVTLGLSRGFDNQRPKRVARAGLGNRGGNNGCHASPREDPNL